MEAQIEKSKELKKGLMQKLLTGKWTLENGQMVETKEFKKSELGDIPVGWEVKKLGEILKVKHGKSQKEVETEEGIYPILGTSGVIGYSNQFLYNKESVLIGRKGTIDKPQYMVTPFWTIDTLFYTQLSSKVIGKWVFYLFQSISWKQYNEASGVPSLSATVIEGINCIIPPKEEQQKIAEILSSVDEQIETKEQKRDKLIELKKGLMQKLLTGKIRVKI